MSGPPSDTFEVDAYEPRRSSRINTLTTADGDTWEERLVVCEASAKKLVIRSYFRNIRTRQRAWDEPPTGASHIEPASSAERRDAEAELKNLQFAMDNGPTGVDCGKKSKASSKEGKSFFAVFRKKPRDQNVSSGKSSKIFGEKRVKKPTIASSPEADDGEEDLQRAIKASLELESRNKTSFGSNNGQWQEDQEALNIVKAIIMSEAQVVRVPPMILEEEFSQKAIEASRTEAMGPNSMDTTGIASMSVSNPEFLGQSEDLSKPLALQNSFCVHGSDSSFFNKKIPAQPSVFPNTAPPLSSACIDPCGPNLLQPPTASAPPIPVAAAPAPDLPSRKPPLLPPDSNFDFDPYSTSPKTVTPSASVAAAFSSYGSQYNQLVGNSNALRKTDGDEGHPKPARGVNPQMHNQKNVQVEARLV